MDKKKTIHCGLCNEMVEDWEKHIATEEHKANIANPELVSQRMQESQEAFMRKTRGQ